MSEHINGDTAKIVGDEYYHAVRVLREKVGYDVIVCCGDGKDYRGVIEQINRDHLLIKIRNSVQNAASPLQKVTLFQGSVKGKNDFIVQKAVELGASEVCLFASRNTVERQVNLDRLNKISVEASKQCGRADIMPVSFIPDFYGVLERLKPECANLFFYECENQNRLPDFLKGGQAVNIVIGSEGGFTADEADAARAKASVLSLGKRILRADTAALSALTLVMRAVGEM